MPQQFTKNDYWAMSEKSLTKNGFPFIAWLLCGDTWIGNTPPFIIGETRLERTSIRIPQPSRPPREIRHINSEFDDISNRAYYTGGIGNIPTPSWLTTTSSTAGSWTTLTGW